MSDRFSYLHKYNSGMCVNIGHPLYPVVWDARLYQECRYIVLFSRQICGQTFSRTEYYREHKRIHTGEKPYKCETCNKTFSRSSNLYTHMRVSSGLKKAVYCNFM